MDARLLNLDEVPSRPMRRMRGYRDLPSFIFTTLRAAEGCCTLECLQNLQKSLNRRVRLRFAKYATNSCWLSLRICETRRTLR